MDVPEPLALEFDQDGFAYEKEKAMPFVTSVERHGIEKGKIEGKIEALLLTFRTPESGLQTTYAVDSPALLLNAVSVAGGMPSNCRSFL